MFDEKDVLQKEIQTSTDYITQLEDKYFKAN